ARVLSSDFSPFGRYVYLSTNAFVHNSSAIKPKPTSADNDLILRFNGVGQIDSFWEVRRAGAALLHTLPDGDVLLAQHKQGTSKLTRFSSSGTQKWSTTFSSSAPCHQLLRDAISVICLPRRLARGALYPKFLLSSGDRLDGLRFPASSPARVPAQAVASGPSGKVIFGGPLSRTNGSLTLVQRKAGETVLLRPDLSGQDRTATVQRRNVPFLPLFQRDYKCRVHVTTGLRAPYEVVVELASSGEEVARQTVTDQSVPSFELLHGKEYNITARENQGSGRTVSSTVTPSCVVNLQ
ncbi:MAG: hypothetical protein HRU11_14530, partial [Parvularculaceae bacterium]|nr:hypothetical protein [Parvularculaceae bacterium]